MFGISPKSLTTLLVSIAGAICMLVTPVLAQQQNPPVNPQVKQFGPRVVKPQAPAQQGQNPNQAKQASDVTIIGKHGAWVVQCDKPTIAKKTGKATPRSCGMLQTTKNPKRPAVGLTLILLKAKQNGKTVTMMRVMAPIGVYLPTGVALEIDGAAVGRVPFTRCLPQTCMAFAEASPPTLSKMKSGHKAKFIVYEAPGLGVNLPISLNGFTAALKEITTLK